ncbi:hypothetical protein Fmac_023163 [Flemingia macrophylla]|uniref:DUF1639 family protein n=1 Tax=Flemingia macrophylla TaxID=520843 RepID=A0ABD1LKS0_9FABA
MVFTGSEGMAMGPERSKPLHNFMLPSYLKWGNQRHLRCTKLPSARSPPPLADHGIDAVREKLMLDLKTEADRIKHAILGAGRDPPLPPDDTGPRTWNLRTRRAPVADNPLRIHQGRSPFRTSTAAAGKSPKLRRSPEKEERPVKFSPTLTKREIEEDFMKMLGHRPHRRPKKRPRNVQRQLDTLYPGQWLSEVSADCYKVPDDTETGKR